MFLGAGLPPVKSVAVVPRGELLVLGLVDVVVLLILALALVIQLVAIWPRSRSRHLRAGILLALAAAATIEYVRRVDPSLLGAPINRLILIAGLLVLGVGLPFAYRHGERALARASDRDESPRLSWFAAALFVTTAIYMLLAIFAHNLNHPRVQAVAVVESRDAPPVVGIYVGEDPHTTPNRLYVGLVAARGGKSRLGNISTGRLIAVQGPAVETVAIGPAEPLEAALARGPRLLVELQIRRRAPLR